MSKFLLANIHRNRILMASVVDENDLKDGVRQMANIAGDTTFDVEKFCPSHASGNADQFANGTMIQYLLMPE